MLKNEAEGQESEFSQQPGHTRRTILIPIGASLLACGIPRRRGYTNPQDPVSPHFENPAPDYSTDITFVRYSDPSEGTLTITLLRWYFLTHSHRGFTYQDPIVVGLSASIVREANILKGSISIVNAQSVDEREWQAEVSFIGLMRANQFTARWKDYRIAECSWNGQVFTPENASPKLI